MQPVEIPQSTPFSQHGSTASSSMDAMNGLLQESTSLTPSSKLIIQISREFLAKAPKEQTLLLTVPLRDLVSKIIANQEREKLSESLVDETLTLSTTITPPPPKTFEFPIELSEVSGEGWGRITYYIECIPEDSIYRKLLACIPIIGIVPTVINERSLKGKIKDIKDPTRLVKLISVKNDYKICSTIREFLTIALAVAGVALSIIGVGFGIGTCIIGSLLMTYHIYAMQKNKQLINQLQTTGYPDSGIRVR